jgi:hypothetical protein
MSFFDATNNIGRFDTKHGDGFIIHFVHVATHDTAHFKAFLTSWEDQLKQNWKSYETVGRMDPIMIYARTGRQINFSIEIPSVSEEEALLNMVQIERMMRMCYPTFEGAVERKETSTQIIVDSETAEKNRKAREEQEARTIFATENPDKDFDDPSNSPQKQLAEEEAKKKIESELTLKDYEQQVITGKITSPTVPVSRQVSFFSRTASTMVSPPLMRIKFANWVSDTNIDKDYSTSADHGTTGPSGESGAGLYGVIENVKFAPDLSENGGFYACKAYGESEKSYLIPKLLKLDIMFTVLHASDLGYNSSTRDLRTSGFPYNAEKIYDNYKKREQQQREQEMEEKFKNSYTTKNERPMSDDERQIRQQQEDNEFQRASRAADEYGFGFGVELNSNLTTPLVQLPPPAVPETPTTTTSTPTAATTRTNNTSTFRRPPGVQMQSNYATLDDAAVAVARTEGITPEQAATLISNSQQNNNLSEQTKKALAAADAQNQQRQERQRQVNRDRERRAQERRQQAEQTRAEAERHRDPVGNFFKGLFGQRQ